MKSVKVTPGAAGHDGLDVERAEVTHVAGDDIPSFGSRSTSTSGSERAYRSGWLATDWTS
jgi:hypothetical protein